MVKIRLTRKGSKNKPFYQIIVTDSRNARDGRFIEKIGFFDPIKKKSVNIDMKRVKYWLSKGAKISERVNYIIDKLENIKN